MNKDHEVWLLQQLADLDATKARLAEIDAACKYHADNASKMGRELEATQLQLGAEQARLAEAERLLLEMKDYIDEGMETKFYRALIARIDAFLRPTEGVQK